MLYRGKSITFGTVFCIGIYLFMFLLHRTFYRYLLRRAEEEVPEDEVLQRSYRLVLEAVFQAVCHHLYLIPGLLYTCIT